jgi:hypothetical protein
MKRSIYICIVFAAIVSLTGCDSGGGSKALLGTTTAGGQVVTTADTSFTTAQLIAFAGQMFTGAMAGFNHATPSINYNYPPGTTSMNMNISGTVNRTSSSGGIETWTLTSVTETLNSYSFQYNSVNYIINGSMTITGSMRIYATTNNSLSPSNIGISGTCSVTSNGIAQNIPVSLSVAVNSTETGGTMTGTIGGVSVNQSF